jgi:SNF2 family DNA or RNA helicase
MNSELQLKAELRTYQRKGVNIMLKRFGGRALCADDMGLGKTLQSITMIHRLQEKTLIVCPSSLKYNWSDEFKKFLPGQKFFICSGRTPPTSRQLAGVGIFICNYEILQFWRDTFIELKVNFLILDESHAVKAKTSLRFKAAYAISKTCQYRICLTGTPIENQPAELWAQMQIVDRNLFPSWLLFIKRYNGAKRNRWGWELKQATNTMELNEILLAKCMVRRKKTEVLKELPEKSRQVIPVEIENRKEYQSAEDDILAWLRKNTDLNLERTKKALALAKMEKLKLISGLGKVDEVASWVNEESQNRKLVVFCHHREVLTALRAKIKNCIVMDSHNKGEERQKIANIFQADEKVRVFLTTIRVGGTGLNLFAASATVFVQLDWNPAKHEQGEDRILRIGQTAKEVNALYFIARGTIEEKIIKLLDLKRANSKSIIDGEETQNSELLTELLKEMLEGER